MHAPPIFYCSGDYPSGNPGGSKCVHICLCNTLAPQIKGNHEAMDHMFPSVLGRHQGVALCAGAPS